MCLYVCVCACVCVCLCNVCVPLCVCVDVSMILLCVHILCPALPSNQLSSSINRVLSSIPICWWLVIAIWRYSFHHLKFEIEPSNGIQTHGDEEKERSVGSIKGVALINNLLQFTFSIVTIQISF